MWRGIIYKYTCIITKKSYIGQTINEYNRRCAFLTKERYCTLKTAKRLSKFDAARKKYGIENFTYEIIEEVFLNSKKELIEKLNTLESYYIEKFDTFYKGYNSTKGGFNGSLSSETKKRISRGLKGRPMSEKTRLRLSFKGHHHTEENKRLISERNKKRFKDKHKHPMFGKHHSEASKLKNSMSRKGKLMGIENKASKPVNCFTKDNVFVKSFVCMADGIRWLNEMFNLNLNIRNVGQISRCCRQKIKSAYGYVWKYKN